MLALFRRHAKRRAAVEFCERRGQPCTSRSRADTLLDNARTRALQLPHVR